MFNKGQLEGILLSIAKPGVHVAKAAKLSIGYRVRVRVCLRGTEEFLLGIQRSLLQHEIDSHYKDEEHSARKKPILIISRLSEVMRLMNILPLDLPANANWDILAKTTFIILQKEHLTQDGLDKILKMKGVL